ncbi:MAG: hypothetical protein IKU37_01245 [Candidatus Gastranaerophilales bacterium]|nr:hypothetical protein [Candidatus Gastranaerophilales bacterium]
MNREKARTILGEGATEEQVTNFLNEWHNAKKEEVSTYENQLNDLKSQIDKYSDYDEIKKQLDEINRANMSEQEKLAQEKQEIQKNLAESRIIKNTAKAKNILAGLNVKDSIIARLVSEDENETLNSVNELKAMLETQKETVAKQTKESLQTLNLDPTLPNVNQNEGNDVIDTFEKFGKLSAEEQNKWINEHPTEFENLS